MQKLNTTNVVLNSIRLATPSVKAACREERSLEKFCAENRQFVLVCEEKGLIIPGCEEKSQNVPVLRCSSCSVLFKHRFSQKQRVGVENHTIATPLHCNASYT